MLAASGWPGIRGCLDTPAGKGAQITPICTSMLHQNSIPVDTQIEPVARPAERMRTDRRLSEAHFDEAQVGGRFCVVDMSLTEGPHGAQNQRAASRRGLAQVTWVPPLQLRRGYRIR
jgi:hypothetical protein